MEISAASMTERSYYKWAVAFPVVVGTLWVVLSGPTNPGERLIRQFFVWSTLVPYAVFAIGFAGWSIEQPTRRIRKAFLLSPLVFSVMVSAVAYPVVLLLFRASYGEMVMGLAPFCLIVGYGCVGLAFAILLAFRALRWVRQDTPPTP